MNRLVNPQRRIFLAQLPKLAVIPFLPAALAHSGCDDVSAQEVEDIIMGILKVVAEAFKIYQSVSGSQEVEYEGTAGQGIKMAVELHEGSIDSSNTKMVDGMSQIYDLVPGKQGLPFDGLKAKSAGTHFAVAMIGGSNKKSQDFVVEM